MSSITEDEELAEQEAYQQCSNHIFAARKLVIQYHILQCLFPDESYSLLDVILHPQMVETADVAKGLHPSFPKDIIPLERASSLGDTGSSACEPWKFMDLGDEYY